MASKQVEKSEAGEAASERALIGRIREGDTEEFKVLVRRYQARIYTLALRLLGSPQEAEDCAQEAFLRAYKNLKQFSGRSSFYTWIYRITVNLALSRLRHLSRRGRGKTESLQPADEPSFLRPVEPLEPGPNPRERLMEKDLEAQLNRALQRLPAGYRAVLVLRDVEGRSYEEVAELMALPLGTVKSRLHQARAKMQRLLAGLI